MIIFLYPDDDPDHSQILTGCDLDQDISSHFFVFMKFKLVVFVYQTKRYE